MLLSQALPDQPQQGAIARADVHQWQMYIATKPITSEVNVADVMLTPLLLKKGKPEIGVTSGPLLLVTLPVFWL